MSRLSYCVIGLSILGTLLITALVYWPGLSGPFLFDDYVNIVESHVDKFSLVEIFYASTHNDSGFFGRLVSVLSLTFTGIVHGPGPWGYKYHNLLIHLINGLLIFWLLLKLLPRLSPGLPRERIVLIAGLSAAVWLLHPLLVSTVLYAVQRMAELTALFTLAALIAYVSARDLAGSGGWKFHVLSYLVFPLCLALAILSKESGGLTIFYVLAIEFIAYRFSYSGREERNRVLTFMGLFVAIPLAVVTVYVVTHFGSLTNYSLRNFDLGERLLTELHVVALYLKMILLPQLSDMTLFHDYIKVTSSFDALTIFLLLCLILAVAMIFYLRTRLPVVSFAIAWFIIAHLMESTFISLELMFEHRNYLASVGPLMAVVYGICNVKNYPRFQYLNGVILLLLAFLTYFRVQEWRSIDLINQVAVIEHPDSARAQTEIANYYYRLGDTGQALEHLHAVQKINPRDFGPIVHEMVMRCGSGTDMSGLLEEAKKRAANYPVTPYSLTSLDNMLQILNAEQCPEVSFDDMLSLIAVAKSQPDNQTYERLIGFLEKIEGQMYMLTGEYQKGSGLYLSAYEKTGMVRILAELAGILLQFNRLDEAELVINYMAEINEESFGIETALLTPLQEELRDARAKALTDSETPEN